MYDQYVTAIPTPSSFNKSSSARGHRNLYAISVSHLHRPVFQNLDGILDRFVLFVKANPDMPFGQMLMLRRIERPSGHYDEALVLQEPTKQRPGGRRSRRVGNVDADLAEIKAGDVDGNEKPAVGDQRLETHGLQSGGDAIQLRSQILSQLDETRLLLRQRRLILKGNGKTLLNRSRTDVNQTGKE